MVASKPALALVSALILGGIAFGQTTLGRILMFSGDVLITHRVTQVGSAQQKLHFAEPVSAITQGASLIINVSDEILSKEFLTRGDEAASLFPEGCIVATLVDDNGDVHQLNERGIGLTNTEVFLMLRSGQPGIVGPKFISVELASCRSFTTAEIRWRNFSK